MIMSAYCLITTTTDSQAEADRLAEMLVSEGLAACVQITPIRSVYTWQGALQKDEEWLLLIKTRAVLYPKIEVALQEQHSYDTPEIICMPITGGAAAYLAWVDETTIDGEDS